MSDSLQPVARIRSSGLGGVGVARFTTEPPTTKPSAAEPSANEPTIGPTGRSSATVPSAAGPVMRPAARPSAAASSAAEPSSGSVPVDDVVCSARFRAGFFTGALVADLAIVLS